MTCGFARAIFRTLVNDWQRRCHKRQFSIATSRKRQRAISVLRDQFAKDDRLRIADVFLDWKI